MLTGHLRVRIIVCFRSRERKYGSITRSLGFRNLSPVVLDLRTAENRLNGKSVLRDFVYVHYLALVTKLTCSVNAIHVCMFVYLPHRLSVIQRPSTNNSRHILISETRDGAEAISRPFIARFGKDVVNLHHPRGN